MSNPPPLIRLYIRSVAIGFGVAAVFVGLLLGLDIGGLRRLILGSDAGLIAVGMLWIFNGIIYAGVQFAWAVMAMAERDDGPPRGRRARLAGRLSARPARLTAMPARAESGGNRGNRGRDIPEDLLLQVGAR